MAAQYLTDWNPTAIVASNTAILGLIDGDTDPGKITVHDSADVELLEYVFTDPAGTVNGTSGLLTLTPADSDAIGLADGTASYATLRDGNDTALRSWPCQEGTSAVPGYFVISSLSVTTGQTVSAVSMAIS